MFTGLIEELGTVTSIELAEAGSIFTIEADIVTAGTANGDSIAVDGVCLTALDVTSRSFRADVSPETLARSTLDSLAVGKRVNLERAVTPNTRLGGHIVQGHVDATGTFVGAIKQGDFYTVTIGFPPAIAPYLIYKGSVAVNGISLTVSALNDDRFDIAVIPKTWHQTNLSNLSAGDQVNLEADVIAKYVERILTVRNPLDRS